jgi:tetratricopeptide (TPR) repeat protein
MKQCLTLLLSLLLTWPLLAHNKDYSGWWIYNYGDYAQTVGKNDPRVKGAAAVFERLKDAADKAEARLPRLFVINHKKGPYALAVPDGGIIINPQTLDICYNDATKAEGDSRLAFILGHELAHLANRDFIHREAFQALQQFGEKGVRDRLIGYFELSDPEKAKIHRERELLADRKGALYAAMAGYNINQLSAKRDNFLKHWARQTGIDYFYDRDPLHPSFQEREQFIRSQLSAVTKQVELFRAGVLLFQIGSYHDSEAAFREFSKAYPAREVLNNIGACYLGLALRHLYLKYSDDYLRFRLSTAIDYATSAETLYPRGEGDYLKDKDISRYINKAEEYFRRAADRDQQDRACRTNLAAALILKKEYAEAQGVCNKILTAAPRDTGALNNKAVAFYYYGKEEGLETGQKAMQILQEARQLEPADFEVLYNLAALKEDRNRQAGARLLWEKYLQLETTPGDTFYTHIYKKLKGSAPPNRKKTVEPPDMPGDIGLGDDFSRIKRKWGQEHTREYKLGSAGRDVKEEWSIPLQVMVKDHIRVIALDNMVEIVEQELIPVEDIEITLKRFGPPPKIVRHTGGNFYVYKKSGFSIKEIDGKARSYIRYEKAF